MSLLDSYTKAMIRGDIDHCIAIEQDFGLFGYSPEVVSIALKAMDDGEDPDDALVSYFDAAMRQEAGDGND